MRRRVCCESLPWLSSNGQLENKVPLSEAKVPIGRDPGSVETRKAAPTQDQVTLAIRRAHLSRESSRHSLACDRPLCHSSPPRQNHGDEMILIFLENHHLNSRKAWPPAVRKAVAMERKRRKSPQISVESHPRTVNIFGSPQRTNAFLSLARSAVLKRE